MNEINPIVKLSKEQWYENLIDDCKSIITEATFNSRWALVEGYHLLGERILQDEENFTKLGYLKMSSYMTTLAESLKISQRTIERAIQFYKKYPNLDLVPEGKNISWYKICNKYLPKPKENKIELPTPEGKYDIIIMDPPWNYGTEYNSETRRVASPYPELSFEELSKIKLPSADNCVLWLWTTHKFIWEAKQLMDLWGFEYKLILVWDKEKLGIGSWLRCQVEFCLLGIKGNPEWNLTNERDLIREARREHSRKPEEFYKLVRKLCKGKIIEYFGRQKREGIDIFGNEPDKFMAE